MAHRGQANCGLPMVVCFLLVCFYVLLPLWWWLGEANLADTTDSANVTEGLRSLHPKEW